MSPASITFYGGVHEIGGNKFLVEDRGTKIFLDFGMQMGKANQYFSEFVNPRTCNCMGDLFEFELLPKLKAKRLCKTFGSIYFNPKCGIYKSIVNHSSRYCFSVFVNFLRSIVTLLLLLLLLDVLLYSTLRKIKLVLGCYRQVVRLCHFDGFKIA